MENKSVVTGEISRLKAMYLRNMADHAIEGYDWGYAMKKLDSIIYSVYIAKIAGRLVITGDFILGHNGVISTPGYDHNWLIGATDPNYLAEKFLQRMWTQRRAELEATDLLNEVEEMGVENVGVSTRTVEGLRRLRNEGWPSEREAYQEAMDPSDWELAPGYGYAIVDMAGLSAVQTKFSELWKTILD